MRPRCVSAHDILLLSILDLLRNEALAPPGQLTTRPDKVQMLADQLSATLTEKAFFDALAGYLHE